MAKSKPTYALASVENALRVVKLLQDGRALRLTDVAREFDIAVSTAHRLLTTLVYQGFAIQDDQKRYLAGSALSRRTVGQSGLRQFRRFAAGPMEIMCDELNESVNLQVRIGTSIRGVLAFEARAGLRVGDRSDVIFSAFTTAAGLSQLASLPEGRLRSLYARARAEGSENNGHHPSWSELQAELSIVREKGYAVNRGGVDPDIGAVGAAIQAGSGLPIASITVTCPLGRLEDVLTEAKMKRFLHYRDKIAEAVRDIESPLGE